MKNSNQDNLCQGAVLQRHAFTLIELLVVISIISLLISILLPALGAARKAAQASACLSNLHQMGMIHVMYDGDTGSLPVFAEIKPSTTSTSWKPWHWRYYVQGYMKNFGMMDCPSIDNHTKMKEIAGNLSGYISEGQTQYSRWFYTEYGVSNNTLFGSYRYTSGNGGSGDKLLGHSRIPARLADLHSPSKIFSTMDTDSFNVSEKHGYYIVTDWQSAPTATGAIIPGARHAKAVNMLWADSHASAVKVGDEADPYNTGMSSNLVKVDGWNYWDRFN
jgi:prepilin-type N-terminal cleavage/methylation domain-containing protein/prepilin-type processing-associated H-X9-DG protein